MYDLAQLRTAREASRAANSRSDEPRIYALILFLACATVLGMAMWLSPNTRGHGTHTKLGLPECGMLVTTGLPCATCGMTTAFSHAVHGQLASAFTVQPAGALLAILTAVFMILAGYAAYAGLPILPLLRRLWTARLVTAGVVIVIAAWAYKIFTI